MLGAFADRCVFARAGIFLRLLSEPWPLLMDLRRTTLAACLLLGLAASVEDLHRRRISNATVLAGLITGLMIQLVWRGPLAGWGIWLAGAAAGFGVFLIFFLA